MRKTKSMIKEMAKTFSIMTAKNYHIIEAYGGYQLVLDEGEGIIDITGFLKAGEMYTVLSALINTNIYNSED